MSRPLRYLLIAAVAVIAVAWGAVAILAPRVEPYLKEHLVRDLSSRFDGSVELGSLRVSGFPQLRVVGENLVLRREGSTHPPIISVRHFDLHVSPLGLLRWPLSVGTVHVSGLSIILPPRGERPKLQSSDASPKTSSKTLFVIGKVVCDETHLEILTDKPGKLPLEFDIQSLVLDSAGPGRAMPFTAKLTNPKPIGDIDTKGKFGPWNAGEPRDTPVSGTYSFTHADLATIHGIGGILSSQGEYSGVLSRIEVQGKTDTPDFMVSTGGHPMPLHTDYNATVDGTTGDTYLHPVRGTLGAHSLILANGSVVREEGGHRVSLDLVVNDARIEELLKVAVKTDPPVLTGPVSFKAKLLLPPGPRIVPERLNLDGDFNLPEGHLSDPSAQEKVDKLSVRAQGHPDEAKEADVADVLSDIQGKFKLKDGTISLSNLNFKIPGASITVAGDYRLEGQDFSFEGQARLDAKLSQLTTGVKSFFLKALDPIFAKNNAGTVLPIRISGTGTSPHVGFDFGHPSRASR